MKTIKPLLTILLIAITYQAFSQNLMKQKLVATSLWHRDYNNIVVLVDSFGYFYSGNRGTYPISEKGNIESLSLYDSCYLAAGAPIDAYGQAFFSWVYNNDNKPISGKSYDSNDTLIYERWNTFYSNDTLSSITEINRNVLTNMILTRVKNYNPNGILARDSFYLQYPGGDSAFSIKNVTFDNSGRIITIDSFSNDYVTFRMVQTNYYNASTSVLPDSDSEFIIEFYPNGTSDTLWYTLNNYAYYPSNLLKQTINYNRDLSGFSDASTPSYKKNYEYNNDGQVTLEIDSTYSGSWWEQGKREYEYTNGVNTLYRFSIFGNESQKKISTLDNRNIVDTVKWYQDGVITDQDVYKVNEFKNRTKYSWTYYAQGLGSPTMGATYYYYYENNGNTSIQSPKDITSTLILYPNPAKDILKYKLNNALLNTKINVSITNIAGRVIYQGSNMDCSGEIDLSKLSAGNYIMNMVDQQGNSGSRKFVKK